MLIRLHRLLQVHHTCERLDEQDDGMQIHLQ